MENTPAIPNSSAHSTGTQPEQKPPVRTPWIFTALIIVLTLTCIIGGYIAFSQVLSLSSANEELKRGNSLLVSRNEELVKQNETLNQDLEALKKDMTDPEGDENGNQGATVKKIEVSHTWNDAGFNFELTAVYFAKELSDLGALKETAEIQGKEFVTVEMKVTDTRKEGVSRAVSQNNYVKLRLNGQTEALSPSLNSVNYLSPGDKGNVYATFAVAHETNKSTLQIGPSGSARNIPIDFSGSTTQILTGTMTFKEGFKTV